MPLLSTTTQTLASTRFVVYAMDGENAVSKKEIEESIYNVYEETGSAERLEQIAAGGFSS